MISKEMLKREIDTLNENQLSRIATFVDLIKAPHRVGQKLRLCGNVLLPPNAHAIFVLGLQVYRRSVSALQTKRLTEKVSTISAKISA